MGEEEEDDETWGPTVGRPTKEIMPSISAVSVRTCCQYSHVIQGINGEVEATGREDVNDRGQNNWKPQ